MEIDTLKEDGVIVVVNIIGTDYWFLLYKDNSVAKCITKEEELVPFIKQYLTKDEDLASLHVDKHVGLTTTQFERMDSAYIYYDAKKDRFKLCVIDNQYKNSHDEYVINGRNIYSVMKTFNESAADYITEYSRHCDDMTCTLKVFPI